MKNSIFSILVLLFLTGITSCTNKLKISKSALVIPDDVFFASRANILRATYQVPNWKELLRDEFGLDIEAEETPRPNFLGSGKAYVFGDVLEQNKNYVAFSILIRSRKNLEEFVKGTNPEVSIQHFKGFRYIIKNKNILGWSQNVLLLLDARQAYNQNQVVEQFKKLVNTRHEDALIVKNENFQEALKNDRDMALWLNIEKLARTPLLSSFVENMKLEDTFFHILANFDEGMISLKTQYFTNPDMYEGYKTLLSSKVNKELLRNVPVENPAMLTAVGVKPSGIKKLLADIQWTKKAENMAQAVTLSLDQFIDMLSGDAVIMLKDIQNLQQDLENTEKTILRDKKAISDIVLGIGIRNQQVYDSLKSIMLETGLLEKREGYYFFFGETYVLEKDSFVYFTKNEQVKDDFFNGVTLKNEELIENAEQHWFIFHADEAIAEKTIKGQTLVKEVARNLLKNEDLKLEYATINLAAMDSKQKGSESIVLLKDKTSNSLLAMLEVLKEIVFQTKIRLDPNFWQED